MIFLFIAVRNDGGEDAAADNYQVLPKELFFTFHFLIFHQDLM